MKDGSNVSGNLDPPLASDYQTLEGFYEIK